MSGFEQLLRNREVKQETETIISQIDLEIKFYASKIKLLLQMKEGLEKKIQDVEEMERELRIETRIK